MVCRPPEDLEAGAVGCFQAHKALSLSLPRSIGVLVVLAYVSGALGRCQRGRPHGIRGSIRRKKLELAACRA